MDIRYDMATLRKIGHCITDVYVADSSVGTDPSTGKTYSANGETYPRNKGLFARRPFSKGEIVTISPVLAFPRAVIDSKKYASLLMNYCITSENSEIAFFPISYAAMINHMPANSANVQMMWYDWSQQRHGNRNRTSDSNTINPRHGQTADSLIGRREQTTTEGSMTKDFYSEVDGIHVQTKQMQYIDELQSISVEDLLTSPFAVLDLSFVAIADIAADQEIFFDYGSSWESAWTAHTNGDNHGGDSWDSVFRHYISAPKGFFPQSWFPSTEKNSRSISSDFIDGNPNKQIDTSDNGMTHSRTSKSKLIRSQHMEQLVFKQNGEVTDNSLHMEADNVRSVTNLSCDLFLAPSIIKGAGRGVFAGRKFRRMELVDRAATITISHDLTSSTQLNNYVFSTDDEGYDMIVLGPLSLFNHRQPNPSISHWWTDNTARDPGVNLQPYSTYTRTDCKVTKLVLVGEEMFSSYGEDDWFVERGIQLQSDHSETGGEYGQNFVENGRVSPDVLMQDGICLSDVYVDDSYVAGAPNLGLFANRDFLEGEVVTISPVIVIAKSLMMNSTKSNSIIINYSISYKNSAVVLLPIAHAGMINHMIDDFANIHIKWYDWMTKEAVNFNSRKNSGSANSTSSNTSTYENEILQKLLDLSVDDLVNAPFTLLDVAYVATKTIRKGEELFVSYGSDWENKYQDYLRIVGHDRFPNEARDSNDEKHLFREFIEAPDGLFPDKWQN